MSCLSRKRYNNSAFRSSCRTDPRLIGLAVLLWATQASAQPAAYESNEEYEKESENPVTRFYTLPLRYKASFEEGYYNATTSTLELSNAVVPIPLNDDWFLIGRSKGAFISQAPKKSGNSWEDGLNNLQTTLFLSPAWGDKFFWGVGPVISFPTATNAVTGQNRWGFGPSVAFTWQGSIPWTFGFVTNNVWSLGGPPDGSNRSNNLMLNPIVAYRFGDGWSVSSSPNITANWASTNDKRWTVPVGAGIGKAFKFGTQPMTVKAEAYYNVARPGDNGSVWAAQLTLTLLLGR
jgi:hypothetical protein